jgi:hypothetical protein
MKVLRPLQIACAFFIAITLQGATPPPLPVSIVGRLKIENPGKILMEFRSAESDLVGRFDLLFKVVSPEREVFLGLIEMEVGIPVFDSGKSEEQRLGMRGARFYILDSIARFEQSGFDFGSLPDGFKINSVHGSDQMDAPIKNFFSHLTNAESHIRNQQTIELRRSAAQNQITKLEVRPDDTQYIQ